jgi:hypothetical protein
MLDLLESDINLMSQDLERPLEEILLQGEAEFKDGVLNLHPPESEGKTQGHRSPGGVSRSDNGL